MGVPSQIKLEAESIRLCGDIDRQFRFGELRNALLKLESTARIQIHLSDVSFMGSAFLNFMISFRRQFPGIAERICFMNPSPSVFEIFRVSGIENFFQFEMASEAPEYSM